MEHMQTARTRTALGAFGALTALMALTNTAAAQAQEPAPEGYAPPQQVYTVDAVSYIHLTLPTSDLV